MFSILQTTRRKNFLLQFVGLLLLVATNPALATDLEFIDKFQGSAATPYDQFGSFVGLDHDSFIVGAPQGFITSEDEDYGCGFAYIFENVAGEWQQEALLYPHDYKVPGKSFGWGVDIDGEYAVVGDPHDSTDYDAAGAIYLFYKSQGGWIETQKLMASDAEPDREFGRAVSLAENLLVVGASYPSFQGKAYVFERTASIYNETQILTASDADGWTDQFATSVVASENWIFIGAPNAENGSDPNGAVYAFARDESGWDEYQKIVSSDGIYGGFGVDVDFDGESLIIGDTNALNSLGQDVGGGWVFTLVEGAWIEQQKLIPTELTYYDSGGYSVGIENGIAVISHPYDPEEPYGSVFVFAFSSGQWSEQSQLWYDSSIDDAFGKAVAINDGRILIGAPRNYTIPRYGSAYLYEVKGAKSIDCIGFDAPLDDYPVTIKGRRPALPLRATLEFEDETLVTDIDITKPPVAQVYFDSAEDDQAMDITSDLVRSITPDEGNEFLFTPGGVWQYILGLDDYSASGTYTVTMESGDTDDYDFNQECMTQFIVP